MKTKERSKDMIRARKKEIAIRQGEKMAALGQMAGGIAHDFNNYLMSIIGNATMIQKTNDIDRIKDYAERIIHISQIAASLTKKILMFSKKESSINKTVNLRNILDTTYNMMECILSKEIELIYSYEANGKIISGDESQLESMIVNMILNSKDAIGYKYGKIKIGTKDTVIEEEKLLSHGEIIKPGKYITIYIEDNGSGMEEETLKRVFEPYFTTKNKSKGTGLGLSVVFGTVKWHSGYIDAKSQVNVGTKFEIHIPVYNNEVTSKKANREIKSDMVMIVDDDINVLDVEAEMIEDLGYEIVKFNDPKKALAYYKKEWKNISFSVIDILMPELSGKDLFEEMQYLNKDVIAIFITGFAQQAEYEELKKRGLPIIEKPFTYEELSEKIAHIYR